MLPTFVSMPYFLKFLIPPILHSVLLSCFQVPYFGHDFNFYAALFSCITCHIISVPLIANQRVKTEEREKKISQKLRKPGNMKIMVRAEMVGIFGIVPRIRDARFAKQKNSEKNK